MHTLLFGIKQCKRNAATKTAVVASCHFWNHYTREEKDGLKRNCTANLKYFKRPFHVDRNRWHLLSKHSMRRKGYADLRRSKKKIFVNNNTAMVHCNIINFYFGGLRFPVHLFVDMSIIHAIIGEVRLQDTDTNKEITKKCALRIPEDVHDASKVNGAVDVATSRYHICLKNPAQFYLICYYHSVGASFLIALRILAMTREGTALASLGFMSPWKATVCARLVCTSNLHSLKDMLACA